MSVPDPVPARKHSRWGLYIPYIIALVAILAWSALWFWARGETERGLNAGAEALRADGYQVSWKDAKVSGYPFRLFVVLTEPSVRDPSGWEIEAPRFEAESFIHGLGRWMVAAPQGLTFVRPRGGAVDVKGQVLRGSLGGLDRAPPRLSLEGVKLAFSPQAGAAPFALAGAERFELHLRPGPEDQGALFVKIDGATAASDGALARAAGAKPVALTWDALFDHASGFKGPGWADAARGWSRAGGKLTVRKVQLSAGGLSLTAAGGELRAGADGRLAGALPLDVRGADRGVAALAGAGLVPAEALDAAQAVAIARGAGGATARFDLVFQAGRTTLGPVALGAAPKVY